MRIVSLLLRMCKLMLVFTSLRMTWAFLRFGVLAGAEHHQVLNHRLKTIVDIGANKGQFSLACECWSPNAKVFAFEPLRSPAKTFKKLFNSSQNIQLHEVAIGPEARNCLMHISAREDSSSLLPIGENQVAKFSGTQEISQSEIQMTPLSLHISSVDITAPAMLKLDVQGFEMQALNGCKNLLHHFDFVYCECSFIELYVGQKLAHDVIDWLRHESFILDGVFNISYDIDGIAIQGDFLFKHINPDK